MKHRTITFRNSFKIEINNRYAQAAQMVISPGNKEGGPDNRHRGSDQWLLVIAGKGLAIINGQKVPLRKHSLVFIERQESHEIRNTGRTPLKTFNMYVPPAYDAQGELISRGRS